MAKSIFLCLSLLALLHSSFARQDRQQFGECNLDRINSRKPDNSFKFEGGRIETWDPNHDQFQCAGVALERKTIEPKGLSLPEYSNAPKLIYIIQGRGFYGVHVPGCAETFEDSQGSRQSLRGERSTRDQHQRIQRFREGDVLAVPAGAVYWSYNDGGERVVSVSLYDVSNRGNQLDANPRKFYLAGNPEEVFRNVEQQESRQRSRQWREAEDQPQYGQKNNVFNGFEARILAEAFNIDEQLARRIKNENDARGNIILVREELAVVRPPQSIREEDVEDSRREERYMVNGVEETHCSMRNRENIGDPSRADLFNPNVGRITTLNSFKLPILQRMRLSAERGTLYQNAMVVPHYTMNAHSIIYAIRGEARIQVVDESGRRVFDGVMRQGEVLTVPQNFAVVKRTEQNQRFEYVAFRTNQNAMITPLAGRTSALRAMPAAVLANAFDISMAEAQRIKFNTPETTLTTARSHPDRRIAA